MILKGNRSTHVRIDNKDYLYFGGTNYLGLAHRIELQEAASKCFSEYGFSSGASRLTSGENEILVALENELAAFADCESALVLPAGFISNQALVEGINKYVDAFVISDPCHAAIKCAVHQSTKPVLVDRPQNCHSSESIRERLGIAPDQVLAVFTEPIDALSGRLAQVEQIRNQLSSQDFLILDEAQSFGVLGNTGAGAKEHFSLAADECLVRTGTFSKAVGTYGGFVLASRRITDSIKQNSASFRGSTSLPPLICAASRESLRLIKEDFDSTIKRLRQNILFLSQKLPTLGFKRDGDAAVPIFYLPYSPGLKKIQDNLPERGIYIPSMSNYFPGQSQLGLRWTIQSAHKTEDLEELISVFRWNY